MRLIAVALAVLAAGCADDLCARIDGSCIELEVRGAGPVDRIDQIVLDSIELGLSFARSPEIAQEATALPVRLRVVPLAHQGLFVLDVEGRLGGAPVGRDTLFNTIVPGQHLKLVAVLATAAPDGGADLARTNDLAARDLATPRDFAVSPPDLSPSFKWVRDTSMSFPNLETVWGGSTSNVYAAGSGGTIFKFNGVGWQTESSGKSHVFHIHGISLSHIYAACANGIVFSTGNGSWTSQFSGADIVGIQDLAFNDQIAGGSSSFFMRSGGNGSWSNQTNPAGSNFLNHFCRDTNGIYAAGSGGSIWHSTGGAFNPESTGSSTLVLSMHCFGFGVWATQEPGVLRSTGNGVWQRETSGLPPTGQLNSIGGAFPDDLYVVGGQKIFHSTGNGVWTEETVPALSISTGLRAVFGVRSDDVWAVGGDGTSGVVLHKFLSP